DTASAEEAIENVDASPWSDRIRIHNMDVRRLSASDRYDLIITNPPFYAGEEASTDARKSVAKHGGELTFKELFHASDKLLADDGCISIVLPLNRENDLRKEAAVSGLHVARRCVVRYLALRPPKRVMLELRRNESGVAEEEVIVEMEPGTYSSGYRALLSDLLLKF
ncbi:MAG: methyltransferase, partial [Flavobacteriales bacterium]